MNIKKLAIITLFLPFMASGCGQIIDNTAPQNAPVLSKTPDLVPREEALVAKDEILEVADAALPCFQFKFRDGFLTWLQSYEKEDKYTIESSVKIDLPEKPDPDFIEALRSSQTEGALQTSLCTIHKGLGVFTWAVEFPKETKIYTYRKPKYDSLTVQMEALSNTGDSYTSTTDLTQMGFPTCLPKKITNSEMIWFCGTPFDNWKQVHVNRKLGNMVQISCLINKDGEDVPVGAGCLVPTPVKK